MFVMLKALKETAEKIHLLFSWTINIRFQGEKEQLQQENVKSKNIYFKHCDKWRTLYFIGVGGMLLHGGGHILLGKVYRSIWVFITIQKRLIDISILVCKLSDVFTLIM